MILAMQTTDGIRRIVTLAAGALVLLLVCVYASPWAEALSPQAVLMEPAPAEGSGTDDPESHSTEAEAALPAPLPDLAWLPGGPSGSSPVRRYLPPDTDPLIPPPRPMTHG